MIDKLEGLALKSISLRDPEYFYRRVCRYYSENFNTPLMEVYELPWAFVFTNYIEHIIETKSSQEDIYDLAVDIHYPEIIENEEEELQDWIRKIEEEEERKRQAKKNKEKEKVKKEGSEEIHIDQSAFSHLDKEMEEEDNNEN